MKRLIFFAILIISLPGITLAQTAHEDTRMKFMATVLPSVSVESVDVMIAINESESVNEVDLTPFVEQSGLIVISGTPYSEFRFRIPLETDLSNQFSERAILTDYRFIAGEDQNPDTMEMISPSACNEITIPESGTLYIRVGGTLQAEEKESDLRGIYTGTLSIDCETES